MKTLTIQEAAQQAMQVQDACNGTAVALLLHRIGQAYIRAGHGTDYIHASAPWKLVLYKLADLTFRAGALDLMTGTEYSRLTDECEALAKELVAA